ncbi:hypothetical protein FZC75_09650 [Sutcliffiella horikoshii]|uniref:Uncharacterized protein n=1 Tax=Sutcliffiella horikoshii TaxID=79883 RepID=A0A5D4T952_9BACI|nr:hypothetical protein FZC75_09650 [Sutcliffiella horikoshii]
MKKICSNLVDWSGRRADARGRKGQCTRNKVGHCKNEILVRSDLLAVDWSKRRRLLREIALGGDPTGEAEEAPAAPLGKRSHLRKSTAVLNNF